MAPRIDRTTRISSAVASPLTTNHTAKRSGFVNLKTPGNLKIAPLSRRLLAGSTCSGARERERMSLCVCGSESGRGSGSGSGNGSGGGGGGEPGLSSSRTFLKLINWVSGTNFI